jgi:ABC-type antimicrobial peptide transport system permease subunit
LAVSGIIAFVTVGILMLGFFLIVPDTYTRMNATDMGAMGNATRDGAYTFALNIQSVTSSILWVLAGATIVIVLAAVYGRRFW